MGISVDASRGEHDAAAAGPIVDIAGITVRFGGIVALNDVSIQADAGEVVGIIGPNGAGKTTLFDVVSGIRKPAGDRSCSTASTSPRSRRAGGPVEASSAPSSGSRPSAGSPSKRTSSPRSSGAAVAAALVADLVSFPTRRRREKARRDRAEEVLERCGLTAVRDESAGSLPIGVARMVEFARAVVDPPKLLLLDEPASGLDHTEEIRLGEQIQAVRAETGCVVLLVEHNAAFVMEQSDRVVVLDLGSVVAMGLPEEIQRNEVVRAAYLGEGDAPIVES